MSAPAGICREQSELLLLPVFCHPTFPIITLHHEHHPSPPRSHCYQYRTFCVSAVVHRPSICKTISEALMFINTQRKGYKAGTLEEEEWKGMRNCILKCNHVWSSHSVVTCSHNFSKYGCDDSLYNRQMNYSCLRINLEDFNVHGHKEISDTWATFI